MTKQLTLVPTDSAPRSVTSVRPKRTAPVVVDADTKTESEWRLDDTTVEIGMRGLASARAALMNSSRDADGPAATAA